MNSSFNWNDPMHNNIPAIKKEAAIMGINLPIHLKKAEMIDMLIKVKSGSVAPTTMSSAFALPYNSAQASPSVHNAAPKNNNMVNNKFSMTPDVRKGSNAKPRHQDIQKSPVSVVSNQTNPFQQAPPPSPKELPEREQSPLLPPKNKSDSPSAASLASTASIDSSSPSSSSAAASATSASSISNTSTNIENAHISPSSSSSSSSWVRPSSYSSSSRSGSISPMSARARTASKVAYNNSGTSRKLLSILPYILASLLFISIVCPPVAGLFTICLIIYLYLLFTH